MSELESIVTRLRRAVVTEPTMPSGNYATTLGTQAADRIEELEAEIARLREAQRWIPAAEEGPPDGVEVLWCRKDAIGTDYLLHTFVDRPGRRSTPSFGTHWKCITPPEEQE